jgi:hypothetical protein
MWVKRGAFVMSANCGTRLYLRTYHSSSRRTEVYKYKRPTSRLFWMSYGNSWYGAIPIKRSELIRLQQIVEVPPEDLRILAQESPGTLKGVHTLERSAASLYKALQAGMDAGKRACFPFVLHLIVAGFSQCRSCGYSSEDEGISRKLRSIL